MPKRYRVTVLGSNSMSPCGFQHHLLGVSIMSFLNWVTLLWVGLKGNQQENRNPFFWVGGGLQQQLPLLVAN